MTTKYPAPRVPLIHARHFGGSQRPKAITIHGTVGSDNPGSARAIAEWWHGPTSPVTSAHYTVDPNETIQSVLDHEVAFHCGSNQDCIGIELCDEQSGPASRWSDKDSTAILKRAARLTAQLCLAYDIEPIRPSVSALKRKGKHGIYGHNDSRLAFGKTTHTDPKDFPWEKFLTLVRVEIASIRKAAHVAANKPPAPYKPTPIPPKLTEIQKFHAALEKDGVVRWDCLSRAVQNGRTGQVKTSCRTIAKAMDRLAEEFGHEKKTRVAEIISVFSNTQRIELTPFRNAARVRPAVKVQYDAIVKAAKLVPKA